MVSDNPSIGTGRITPGDPWILSQWFTGDHGQRVSQTAVDRVISQYRITSPGQLARALGQHGLTQWTRSIPVSRLWPMQFVEGAWLLVLPALLVAGTVWLVRRRAA